MKTNITVILDSGIGGFTFLNELLQRKTPGDYLYIGDTLNAPYGEKNPVFLQQELYELFTYLQTQYHIEQVILACNTASVCAADFLRKTFGFTVLNVVDVTLSFFKQLSNINIDWLATPTTINTHFLTSQLNHLHIHEVPCKLFAPFIESDDYENCIKRQEVVTATLLTQANLQQADCVILGCTHYPFLLKEIQALYTPDCFFFDPSKALATLVEQEPLTKTKNSFTISFYQTGNKEFFSSFVQRHYHQSTQPLFYKKHIHSKDELYI